MSKQILAYIFCPPEQKAHFEKFFQTYQSIKGILFPIIIEHKQRQAVVRFLKDPTFSSIVTFDFASLGLPWPSLEEHIQHLANQTLWPRLVFLGYHLLYNPPLSPLEQIIWDRHCQQFQALASQAHSEDQDPLWVDQEILQEFWSKQVKNNLKQAQNRGVVLGRPARKSKLDVHKKFIHNQLLKGSSKTLLAKKLHCTREQLYRWLRWNPLPSSEEQRQNSLADSPYKEELSLLAHDRLEDLDSSL